MNCPTCGIVMRPVVGKWCADTPHPIETYDCVECGGRWCVFTALSDADLIVNVKKKPATQPMREFILECVEKALQHEHGRI